MTDGRIPLRFAAAADIRPGEAVLWEDGAGSPPGLPPPGAVVARFGALAAHRPGCFCCGGRGPAAVALGALFQDRARGRVAWFAGVVAVVRDPAGMAAELAGDVLVAARYRFTDRDDPYTSR